MELEERQTRTSETKALQQRIESVLKTLGWSRNKLAKVIYTHCNEVDNDDELRKFNAALAKRLTRKETPPELLQNYLDIISRQPAFEKANLVMPASIGVGMREDVLTSQTKRELTQISKNISLRLQDSEDDAL